MANSAEWFVALRNGSVRGPFDEARIRTDVDAQKIPHDASIRQGKSRWYSFEEIQRIFADLGKQGWFVKRLDCSIEGPFTEKRFKKLCGAKAVTSHTLVRIGSSGHWLPLGLLKTNRAGT